MTAQTIHSTTATSETAAPTFLALLEDLMSTRSHYELIRHRDGPLAHHAHLLERLQWIRAELARARQSLGGA